jgi:hypothetical protein
MRNEELYTKIEARHFESAVRLVPGWFLYDDGRWLAMAQEDGSQLNWTIAGGCVPQHIIHALAAQLVRLVRRSGRYYVKTLRETAQVIMETDGFTEHVVSEFVSDNISENIIVAVVEAEILKDQDDA